jgi:ketosteroid isomerase-like protein
LNPEELKSFFKNQIAVFSTGDVNRLLELYSAEAILRDMTEPASPFVGKASIGDFLHDYFADLTDLRPRLRSLLTGPQSVGGELELTAVLSGDADRRSESRTVTYRYFVIESIDDDGLISEERFYWDSATSHRSSPLKP